MTELQDLASLDDSEVTFSNRKDFEINGSEFSDEEFDDEEYSSGYNMESLKAQLYPSTDPRSPYYIDLPTHGKPLKKIVERFRTWQKVLHSLIHYYKALCEANERIAKIHMEVLEYIDFPMFSPAKIHSGSTTPKFPGSTSQLNLLDNEHHTEYSKFSKPGSKSISDIPHSISAYHRTISNSSLTCTQRLKSYTIPRLTTLKDSLNDKITEIKSLNKEFSLFKDLKDEIAITGQCLDSYMRSLCNLDSNAELSATKRFKQDPFFEKFKLDYQLSHQIMQEGFLRESYYNLQKTASELEVIVVDEIKSSLRTYGAMINDQAKAGFNQIVNGILEEGFVAKPSHYEWESFVERDNNMNLVKSIKFGSKVKYRKVSDIVYPLKHSFISKCIKFGNLKKKTVLGNYRNGLYILTSVALFEFEPKIKGSANASKGMEMKFLQNSAPTAAYNLNNCHLLNFNANKHRFEMVIKEGPEMNKTKVFFKATTSEEALQWYQYLKTLTGFDSPLKRARFLEKSATKNNWKSMTVNQKSQDSESTSHYKPELIKQSLTELPPEIVISSSTPIDTSHSETSSISETTTTTKRRFWKLSAMRTNSSGSLIKNDKRPTIFLNQSASNVLEHLTTSPSRNNHVRSLSGV